MSIFADLDSDIQSQIPDRPKRPIPSQIPMSPQIPWLASNFNPEAEAVNPATTPKALIQQVVGIIIRVGCILGGATPFLLGFITLQSFYK